MCKFLFKQGSRSVYYHVEDNTFSVKEGVYGKAYFVRVQLDKLPYALQADAQRLAVKHNDRAMFLLG